MTDAVTSAATSAATSASTSAGKPARGLHPPDKVADYRARGWWGEQTLDGLFADQVLARGDAVAVVDPANRGALLGSPPRRLTWHELDAEVTALAGRLLSLGLVRGDVLAVQLPNTVELVEVYLAAWRLGVVVSPLPVQLREREVASMCARAGVTAYVSCARFGERHLAADAATALADVESVRAVVAYGPESETSELPIGVRVWHPEAATDADRRTVEAQAAGDPNEANDAVTICWTSGTESAPKGVPRCHMDWLAVGVATTEAPQVTVEDVLLNPFPMINMAGISGMFLPWLLTGCVLVQHHPFDLPTFLGQVATERVTYTCAPPALLWMLLGNEELMARVDVSSLTRIGSGSAPLQPAMVRGWQERRGISVINFFGSNEGIGLLSSPVDFPDPDDRAQFFPRFGAPGVTWSTRAGEWTDTRLVDIVTGEDVTEPGHPGELHISGPSVFAGYLHGEELPSPFDDRGYLRTGDLFEIAGDRGQFLRYLDRARDQVIRGGTNIAPAELEGLIADHPAVADVAVIGDPDERLGERVAAVVVLRPGETLTLEELVAWLRQRKIASFKLPERLEVRDELPRNAVGKVLKRMLRRTGVPE
ncbi:class I adenylate-forming enzyme family protein [Terrabacter sp. C0L_2]|uniref:class I adenylate-forming enzyme family protein n=1 Tax=Terrabacter sp. C0L_2 TaxID=3108389 RepID=UPI002ED5A75A|nr:class I adenylate-forming enzyme family protein [Terrabacter sp. C0L_2]